MKTELIAENCRAGAAPATDAANAQRLTSDAQCRIQTQHWAFGVERSAFAEVSREQFHHLLGQLRADAGFFVLEVDVRVAPTFFLFAHKLGPALDVDLGVIFAT